MKFATCIKPIQTALSRHFTNILTSEIGMKMEEQNGMFFHNVSQRLLKHSVHNQIGKCFMCISMSWRLIARNYQLKP